MPDWHCESCHEQGLNRCFCTVDVAAPLECVTCARSNERSEMYAEMPECGDWNGRGFVMRIGCGCVACLDLEKDDTRTEFETYANAVEAWNAMQEQILNA